MDDRGGEGRPCSRVRSLRLVLVERAYTLNRNEAKFFINWKSNSESFLHKDFEDTLIYSVQRSVYYSTVRDRRITVNIRTHWSYSVFGLFPVIMNFIEHGVVRTSARQTVFCGYSFLLVLAAVA